MNKSPKTITKLLTNNSPETVLTTLQKLEDEFLDKKKQTALLCLIVFSENKKIILATRQLLNQSTLGLSFPEDITWYDADLSTRLTLLSKYLEQLNATQYDWEVSALFFKEKLKNIKELSLEGDQLAGFSFGLLTPEHFPDLEEIELKNYPLDKIPVEICRFENLQRLQVTNCQLTELPPELENLKKLRVLDVAHNQLVDIDKKIAQLPELAEVHLGHNYLFTLPKRFGKKEITLKGWANPYITLTGTIGKKLAADYTHWQEEENQRPLLPQNKAYLLHLILLCNQYKLRHDLSADDEVLDLLRQAKEFNSFERLVALEYLLKNEGCAESRFVDLLITGILDDDADEEEQELGLDIHNFNFQMLAKLGRGSRLLQFAETLVLRESYPKTVIDLSGLNLSNLKKLDLSGKDLDYFPRGVSDCTALRELLLHRNNITEVPWGIEKLQELRKLNLNNNEIKEVPDSIAQLKLLRTVYINHNKLSSLPKELFTLPNLQTLEARYNQLTELPEDISETTVLNRISLSHNELTFLPKNWEAFTKLQNIDLSHNKLTYLPESLGNLPRLKILEIEYNELEKLPRYLHKFNLRKGFLNNFYGSIPLDLEESCIQSIKSLPDNISQALFTQLFCIAYFYPKIQVRRLAITQIKRRGLDDPTQTLPEWTHRKSFDYVQFLYFLNEAKALFPGLQWRVIDAWVRDMGVRPRKRIELNDCYLQEFPPFYFKYWQNQRVNLSGNLLHTLPEELKQLPKIIELDMSWNMLRGLPTSDYSYLSEIKELNLSGNFLVNLPETINSPESLDLSHNMIRQGLSDCTNFPRLKKLNLSFNNLFDWPITEPAHFAKLQVLDLSFNKLTQLPVEITQLEALQVLDLSYNDLGKTMINSLKASFKSLYALPLEIGYLEELTHLYLQHNELNMLPPGIGLIEKLTVLNCSNNQFQELPLELCEAEMLEVIDFSDNQVIYIPIEIAHLPMLKKLILSGNPLSTYEIRKARKLLPNIELIFEAKYHDFTVPVREDEEETEIDEETEKWKKKAKQHLANDAIALAVECYGRAAKMGSVEAMNSLGNLYQDKYQEDDWALYWFRKAGAHGHAESLESLGTIADESQNIKRAMYWYAQAAGNGNIIAQLKLGKIYSDGAYMQKQKHKAIYWYKKAVAEGSVEGQLFLTGLHHATSANADVPEITYWYEKMRQILHSSENVVMQEYFSMKKLEVYPGKMIASLQSEANAGDIEAMFNLGNIYYDAESYNEAKKWYRAAANDGHLGAQECFGAIYAGGIGGDENNMMAILYNQKAAKQGSVTAQNSLGRLYLHNLNDYNTAYSCFKKAANKGDKEAMQNLADMYRQGWGVKKDLAEADKWYNKSKES